MLTVPSAGTFFAKAGPSVDAYAAGDRPSAVAIFLSAVSGLDWDTCRSAIDEHVPGGVAQAIDDADTFFGIELPALQNWTLTSEQASTIGQPVLTVLGTRTEPLFVEAVEWLRRWLPRIEDSAIDGVGHLLHMQRPAPVAREIAAFIGRHTMTGAVTHDNGSAAGVDSGSTPAMS